MIIEYIESEDANNLVKLSVYTHTEIEFEIEITSLHDENDSKSIIIDEYDAKWLRNKLNDFIINAK